jgi:hypothetical protein
MVNSILIHNSTDNILILNNLWVVANTLNNNILHIWIKIIVYLLVMVDPVAIRVDLKDNILLNMDKVDNPILWTKEKYNVDISYREHVKMVLIVDICISEDNIIKKKKNLIKIKYFQNRLKIKN